MDEAGILGGGWGQVWQIPSPYGVGGETCYTAQEDLKFVNRYNVGEGRTVRVWFFSSYIPGPSLVLASLPSLGQHIPPSLYFLGTILWPLLIPCSCLTVYLFPFSGIWEPSLRGNGVMTTLASSGYTGASWGSGFPLPAFCQGAFTEGEESPWNDKVACFSIVWVLAREYSCHTTTWRFAVF